MTSRVLAVAAAAVLAACGDEPAPYSWRAGTSVRLDVTFREELFPVRSSRELGIVAAGAASSESVLDVDIRAARHTRSPDGVAVVRVDTNDVAAAPDRTAEDAAIAGVLAGLVGRRITLEFDARKGLVGVRGFADALAAATPEGDPRADEAAAGLRKVLADDSALRTLRAAGLCEVPAAFRDVTADAARRADVRVPGRGVTGLVFQGRGGRESDGSPVLRFEGRMAARAEFEGDGGAAPPETVGAVVVPSISGDGETMYHVERGTPLRGHVTLRLPFESGAILVASSTFVLVAGE